LEIKVPILILQPIIENAVNHGVLPKENGGFIQICILRNDKYLTFSVKDNGVGMDEEKLKSLFHYKYGSGVGLSNIDKRLKGLYGEGLSIESILDEGTTVSWRIPLKKLE
jgi:sensor histidine kinase YesM